MTNFEDQPNPGPISEPAPFLSEMPVKPPTTRTNSNFYRLIKNDCLAESEKLLETCRNRFQMIYLDPPYNTGRTRGARKLFLDSRSNWNKTLAKILQNSFDLLSESGFLVISINQTELFNLKNLCDEVFGDGFIGLFPVKIRHRQRQLMINATYHDVFEYLLFYRKSKKTRFFTETKLPKLEKFVYRVEILDEDPAVRILHEKRVEIYQPAQYRIVKAAPGLENLRRYLIAGKIATANWSGEFFEKHIRGLGPDLLVKVYGLDNAGLGYRWFQTQTEKRRSGVYFQSSVSAGRPLLPTNDLDFTEIVPAIYKEGGAGCDYKDSKKPEELLEFIINICTREGDLIGDWFGGSGTTLAKAVKMNRSCIICENNPTAFSIIKNRLQNLRDGRDLSGEKHVFELDIFE
jgi:adenine-specific DNA-methyltransferase